MSLAVTLLILAGFLDGLLEGARWTDTEDAWLRWPEGKGKHDLYHLARFGVRVGALCVVILGIPSVVHALGAGALAFAFSEIGQDAYTSMHLHRGLTFIIRWRKWPTFGVPRFALIEKIVALLLGGWALGL